MESGATSRVPSPNPTGNLKRDYSQDSAGQTPEDTSGDSHASKRVKMDIDPESADADVGDLKHIAAETPISTVAETSTVSEKSVPDGTSKQKRGKDKDKNGKDKYKGRRSRGTRNEEAVAKLAGEGATSSETRSKAPRLPKRQCALLIGFCGTGFNGMQIQFGTSVRTIEGVLFDALVKAGAVSQDNADDPMKSNLGRAARTDAGVHAAGNVVSMKIIVDLPGVPDVVARINEELPPQIRVWDYVRVTNSFNARLSCDSRQYTYFFPSYLLIPPKPPNAPQKDATIDSFWQDRETDTPLQNLARKREWRISPDRMDVLRTAAAKLTGTHNFHNFTVGRDFGDRSNQRFMKTIELSDPVVYGETEWISVLFHGQSFMLHQIRKMMAILVLSCRSNTPPSLIDELYGPRTVLVPKMPSLGLLLESPIFESYNAKMERANEKLDPTHQDYRHGISFEPYREKIAAFKQTHIYENMRAIEDRDGLFDAWIRTIDSYVGSDLAYLNSKGTIPPEAVIIKGQQRPVAFMEKKKFDATGFSPEDAKAGEEDENEEEIPVLSKASLAEMEG